MNLLENAWTFKPNENGFKEKIPLKREINGFDEVILNELDLNDVQVLDSLMWIIRREQDAGTIECGTRYTGKHPEKRFSTLYPKKLNPLVLGFFLPSGQPIAWLALLEAFNFPEFRILSLFIKKEFQNLGMGKKLMKFISHEIRSLPSLGKVKKVIFRCLSNNIPMAKIGEHAGFKKESEKNAPTQGKVHLIFSRDIKDAG